MLNNKSIFYIGFLLFLTIIITFAPFFKVGITTPDDLSHYMTYLQGKIFDHAWLDAQAAGRFYFIITKPFCNFSYIGDNFYLSKLIQITSLLLSYILFAILINKIFQSKPLALLLFLLLIIATPISANYHMPFIAYPFYFTFSFSLLIFSVLIFMKYHETNKYKFVIISALCFFIALLFYETYLTFLLFMVIYIIVRNKNKIGFIKTFQNRIFYKEILPFVFIGILYVSTYFIFRLFVENPIDPNNFYPGSSFVKNFSLINFFGILWATTKTAFPLQIYHLSQGIISQNSMLISGHEDSVWYVIKNAELLTFINALLHCFLFVFFFKKLKNTIPLQKIGLGFLFALIFAFSSHIILAISEKYNAYEYENIKAYVTTYYSYFGIMLALILLAYAILKIFYKYKYIKPVIIGIFTCLVFYVSIFTSYTNENISRDWQRSHNRFVVIDELINKDAFLFIEEGSIIYSPDLYESSILGHGVRYSSFSWDQYIYLKSNNKFILCRTPESFLDQVSDKPNKNIYRILKKDVYKSNDFLLVIAKVDRNSIDFDKGENMFDDATCNEAEIHYYSATKKFAFIFSHADNKKSNDIIIDDHFVVGINKGVNNININNINKNEKITSFNIKSTGEIYTERFFISNMINKYRPIVNIAHNAESLYQGDYKLHDADSLITFTEIEEYPKPFISHLILEKQYSILLLSVSFNLIIPKQEAEIQLVTLVMNSDYETIYWDNEIYKKSGQYYFTKVLDLEKLKLEEAHLLSIYFWNLNHTEFSISNIDNTFVKGL